MHTLIHAIVIAMTAIVLISLVIDCRQTLQIKNHLNMYEINPILGTHPVDWKIIVYFIICGAVLTAMALFDPWHWPSLAVLGAVLALEVWVIRRNRSNGLHF